MLGKKRYLKELSKKAKEKKAKFVMVSDSILALGLPPTAFRVLVCLLFHSEAFHPSRKLIKNATGMSLSAIDVALKVLQRQNILEIVLNEHRRPTYSLNTEDVWRPFSKAFANRPVALKEGTRKYPSFNQLYNAEYKKMHKLTKAYGVEEIADVLDSVEKLAHWSSLVRIAVIVDPSSRPKFTSIMDAFVDHGLSYLGSNDVAVTLLRERLASDRKLALDGVVTEHLCPSASNLLEYLARCISDSPHSVAVGAWTRMFGLLQALERDPTSLNCIDVFADKATQKAMLANAASLGAAERLREASALHTLAKRSREAALPRLENELIVLRGGDVVNNVVSMVQRNEAT